MHLLNLEWVLIMCRLGCWAQVLQIQTRTRRRLLSFVDDISGIGGARQHNDGVWAKHQTVGSAASLSGSKQGFQTGLAGSAHLQQLCHLKIAHASPNHDMVA